MITKSKKSSPPKAVEKPPVVMKKNPPTPKAVVLVVPNPVVPEQVASPSLAQRLDDLCMSIDVRVDGDIDFGEKSAGIAPHRAIMATRLAIRDAIIEELNKSNL